MTYSYEKADVNQLTSAFSSVNDNKRHIVFTDLLICVNIKLLKVKILLLCNISHD
jgi:hypothetical protein